MAAFLAFMRSRFSWPGLGFVLLALAVLLVPIGTLAWPSNRVLRIEANNYAFTPGEIHVNPGDRVTIELISRDVAHGLTIDGYPGVDLHAEPGQPDRVTFVADRAGMFKFRCSIACGNLHPFMTGKIEVGPNAILLRAAGLGLLAFLYGGWRAFHG
jgi:heme/copper-type cytochrome/quinol oxidase subunit 2